jgi:hypothetical protein
VGHKGGKMETDGEKEIEKRWRAEKQRGERESSETEEKTWDTEGRQRKSDRRGDVQCEEG